MAIDIKTSVTQIIVLEMTQEDALKLYNAIDPTRATALDADDQEAIICLSRAIWNTIHPNKDAEPMKRPNVLC